MRVSNVFNTVYNGVRNLAQLGQMAPDSEQPTHHKAHLADKPRSSEKTQSAERREGKHSPPAERGTCVGGESFDDTVWEVMAPEKPKRQRSAEEQLHNVRTNDKVVYTLSVMNVLVNSYLLGAAPQYFHWYHSPKALGYMAHRFITFKRQGQHYLLFDFCYFVNLLSLVYVWVFPQNETMFQILYMLAHGPLAWSVLAFSQSMIFHSAPHMTSVFIHTSPMALAFAIRWSKTPFKACSNFPECDGPETDVLPMVWRAVSRFYIWWAVSYYVIVFCILGPRIRCRGYKTLFDRVIKQKSTQWLTKVSKNELVQKAAYLLTHFVFGVFTMVLAGLYWKSWILNIAFVIAIASLAAWNASGFYFTVFLAKYEEELRQRIQK